jgi:two-component sensor histidine kinase
VPELTFAETPERREILDTLEKVVTLLKSRAAVHRAARSEVRHHRAMNRAQTAQNLADMLALDWTQDDAEAAARPPV